MARSNTATLAPFLLLFAALYAGFGVQSPFLPALLAEHGLAPAAIGLVMGAGTAVRLAAGPAGGVLADRFAAPRLVFAGAAGVAALAVFGYLAAAGFGPLLAVALMQAAALAPLAPLGDSLVLSAAAPQAEDAAGPGFDYGWVRGGGSAAFIVGSVASGQIIARLGLGAIVWLHAALLAGAAVLAPRLPSLAAPAEPANAEPQLSENALSLFRIAEFRRVLAAAALILGSHALHDNFAVIRWRAAGIGTGAAGLLWAEAVLAEVVVFVLLGTAMLRRLGPAGAAVLAACAGILRWSVAAQTAWLPALALIQPLHGLTFALLHLACMRRLAECVPSGLAATALTLYGTVGIGAATAVLTFASGELYGILGAGAFWVMAGLCVVALPLARRL